MKKLWVVLCFLFFSAAAFAAPPDYPSLTGRVVDEAGILTPETKARLSQILGADKDNQVVVAVLKDLRGQDGREYGIELARRWQLGQKGKDNGVLFFISPKDRYAGIEVGYGLEGVLPDSLAGRILREVVFPPIKQGNNYNQAVLNGAAAIMSVVSDKEAYVEEPFADDTFYSLLVLLVLIWMLSGKGRSGGGGGFIFPGGGFGRGLGGGFRGGGGGFGGGGAGGRF